jgi:hypothetical protein
VQLVPNELPDTRTLLDSSGLRQAVNAETFTLPAREHVFSVVIGETGRPTAVVLRDSSLPSQTATALRLAVIGHLRTQPPGDVWGVRVAVTVGPAPSVRIEQAEMCRPTLDLGSLATFRQSRYQISRESARAGMRNARNFRFAVAIDREGAVTGVSILQSFGSLRRDEIATEEIENWRFRPLRIDGVAAAAVIIVDDLELMSLIGGRR